jgi:hypothetical protein
MKYEEAYYYFAVFLGKEMKHIANYEEGFGVWEVFWSNAKYGKTEGFSTCSDYALGIALKKLESRNKEEKESVSD